MVGRIGVKSGNVYLHAMEALTELADFARDPGVEQSLAESIELTRRHFFPDDPPAPGCTSCRTTGRRSPTRFWNFSVPAHGRIFAWLMLDAERVLGRPPSTDYLLAVVNHTLHRCWDAEHGGIYEHGAGTTRGRTTPTSTGGPRRR